MNSNNTKLTFLGELSLAKRRKANRFVLTSPKRQIPATLQIRVYG